MTPIHRKRLRKLADFLAGPVARAAKRNKAQKFDMTCYANNANLGLRKEQCGSAACALGWATHVFPRVFKIGDGGNGDYALQMNGEDLYDPETAGEDFFGLTMDEATEAFGGEHEGRTIAEEVAILRRLAGGKR